MVSVPFGRRGLESSRSMAMKFFPPIRRFLICLAAAVLPVWSGAALTEIELIDGGLVRGELLAEKPDRLIVDLGFSVLAVPRDVIASFRAEDAPEIETQGSGGELFRRSVNPRSFPVREWVSLIAEAVVLVRTPTGLGSGFIIHPSGFLVTNDHVVAGEHEISVTVYEDDAETTTAKRQFDQVRIVAASAELDLALLKIEGVEESGSFETVPLGEAGVLRQGQPVFAIGSPLGLERTVSQGIVSRRNRLIGGHLYIQTTAQINPGNSGGPLFNTRGEVVGVNNMKVVAQGAEGLGFAIPAETVVRFLRNRDVFAFDPRNPNAGFRYNAPPLAGSAASDPEPQGDGSDRVR